MVSKSSENLFTHDVMIDLKAVVQCEDNIAKVFAKVTGLPPGGAKNMITWSTTYPKLVDALVDSLEDTESVQYNTVKELVKSWGIAMKANSNLNKDDIFLRGIMQKESVGLLKKYIS